MAKKNILTDEDLANMLKNKHIKATEQSKKTEASNKISLGEIDKDKITKIALSDNTSKPKKAPVNITDINKSNKESIVKYSVSDNHISFVFSGAKLLSINQIFSLLQQKNLKYSVFTYKKCWHNIIREELFFIETELKKQGKKLPFFNSYVEITIFRQAPRLVDEDALSTMFKFIIDALKRNNENPYGILADDNPKIVHKITSYGDKGDYAVGIKVKLIDKQKDVISIEQLLNN